MPSHWLSGAVVLKACLDAIHHHENWPAYQKQYGDDLITWKRIGSLAGLCPHKTNLLFGVCMLASIKENKFFAMPGLALQVRGRWQAKQYPRRKMVTSMRALNPH